jgi:hypothetical protein
MRLGPASGNFGTTAYASRSARQTRRRVSLMARRSRACSLTARSLSSFPPSFPLDRHIQRWVICIELLHLIDHLART